jgi:hypothetical protein
VLNLQEGVSVLSLRGEEILERMVEVVIHNLRRNRDRLLDPDKDLEDSAVRRQLENEKLLRGQYSGRAGTIYALVELKVKMALADYWDRIYEPLEETAIFPKAVSESAVLIVISRLSKSEWATEKVFRYITGIAKTIRDNSRR